jgi:hypothetical protein
MRSAVPVGLVAVRKHPGVETPGYVSGCPVGTKAGARASRVRVRAARPNQGWNHSAWETVFGATPKTATGTVALSIPNS